MDILNTNRPYKCYCGTGEALKFAAQYIFDLCNADVDTVKIAVVSDRVVSGYYFNSFENQFLDRGVKTVLVPVECNDGNKNLKAVSEVYDFLTDFGFGNNDWVIALGGGSIIDVTGFCASIFEGGINSIAIPTTPDAMYESSVATNVYLNSKKLKNALSVPFKPNCVIIDPKFLSTVPDKINHNGYAFIVRLAILGDLSILLDLVAKKNDREFLNRVFTLRSKIVSANPKLLQLGNEISTAIESYFRFMNYSEGEALALSLYSCVDEKNRIPLAKIYSVLGLPTKLEGVSAKSIVKILEQNLIKNGNIPIEIVNNNSNSWSIMKLEKDEALSILCNRLTVISK
ncbi:MAG: iron-containing alcohol dehydrogenase [Saccharofermentans sp.]|nr:iron-containing alcohol dehydrogenase [Saccharofermentans sp.]